MQLGEVAAHIFSGRPVKRAEPGEGSSTRVVGLRDVGRRLTPGAELEEIEAADAVEVERVALHVGDVVATSRGSNVRAAVALDEHAGAIAGPNLIVVRLRPGLEPELLAAYLRHPQVSAQLLSSLAGSSTPGFTIDGLKRLEVEVIDPSCSSLLAELVRRVDAYSEYHQRAVAAHQKAADEAVFERLSTPGGAQR